MFKKKETKNLHLINNVKEKKKGLNSNLKLQKSKKHNFKEKFPSQACQIAAHNSTCYFEEVRNCNIKLPMSACEANEEVGYMMVRHSDEITRTDEAHKHGAI